MRFSIARLRRRLGFGSVAFGLATGAFTLLISIHEFVESAEWLKQELSGMNQYLALVAKIVLSPAFYAALSLSVTLYLIVKVATKPVSSRAESFIETAERWITSAQGLLKTNPLSYPTLRTWQAKAELDLSQFMGYGGRDLYTFRQEGVLLPTEFELGEIGVRSALKRQIRFLKEKIAQADRNEMDFEPTPSSLTL